MIGFGVMAAAVVLGCGVFIHLIYKYIIRRKKYKGVTAVEGLIISAGSVLGIAGCATGGFGFGIPLPLIIGLPLHFIFKGNESCGWSQAMIFSDPHLADKFLGFPIAWAVVNLVLLGTLYYLKRRSHE